MFYEDTHCLSTLLADNSLLLHVTFVAENHFLNIFISMLKLENTPIITLQLFQHYTDQLGIILTLEIVSFLNIDITS